jgi:hypothetical protein
MADPKSSQWLVQNRPSVSMMMMIQVLNSATRNDSEK